MMPSALASIALASVPSLMLLAGRPASTPASWPSSAEPSPSSAPASTSPLVSAMARTSVRPIRPPAPATISRMSAIWSCSRLRLRTVVAFDDDQVGQGMRLTNLQVRLIFRRIVAGQRRRIVGKLDDDMARVALALRALVFARADDELAAEFLEDR